MITAEREDAILRADKAELETNQLRAQLVNLQQQQLTSFTSTATSSASPYSPRESSHVHEGLDSHPSQPPPSTHDSNSDLSAQVVQLTEQLEAAALSASMAQADLAADRARLQAELSACVSDKAALSTEVALLTQQAEADQATFAQQKEELTSARDAQSQRAENLSADLTEATRMADSASAERDSFAERCQELESELQESNSTAEAASAEKAQLSKQLDKLTARAQQSKAAEEELQLLKDAHQELQEKLQGLEEEAQENFDKFTAKEEVCFKPHLIINLIINGHPSDLCL